jgi:hypothetical protein
MDLPNGWSVVIHDSASSIDHAVHTIMDGIPDIVDGAKFAVGCDMEWNVHIYVGSQRHEVTVLVRLHQIRLSICLG